MTYIYKVAVTVQITMNSSSQQKEGVPDKKLRKKNDNAFATHV